MNNLAFGSYYHTNSILHRLDPRIKFISLILFMVSLFLIKSSEVGFIFLGGMGVICIILILLSKVPLGLYLKSLKQILFLVIFSFIFQVLFNHNGDLVAEVPLHFGLINILIAVAIFVIYIFTKRFIPTKLLYLLITLSLMVYILTISNLNELVYSFGNVNVGLYKEGVFFGLFIILRVFILIIFSTLFTLTTKPTDINDGLESLLSPLEKLHIKTSILAMMISLALRYIPTLFNETSKILKAQASRGVDFNEGKLKDKISQIISLLVPMFVISFKRAEDLANAMEARGYVPGDKRSKLNELKLTFKDIFALILVNLVMAGIIVSLCLGVI